MAAVLPLASSVGLPPGPLSARPSPTAARSMSNPLRSTSRRRRSTPCRRRMKARAATSSVNRCGTATATGQDASRFAIDRYSPPHVLKHGGGRPTVDLQSVFLLIRAERRAREHAGFAIDLVLVETEPGQPFLHQLDIRGLELRILAPRRLELAPAGYAVAQVADEQDIEIRKIIVLEDVIILRREEGRTVTAFRLQQRGVVVQLRRTELATIGRSESGLQPGADRLRHFGHADAAIR